MSTRAASRADSAVRWTGWVLLVCAVLLLPWIIGLALTLPTTVSAHHWSEAWVGLDLMETVGLAVTGWLVLRRDIRVQTAASATAAFLVADAWFDVATAQPDWDLLQAATLAILVELPLAALCLAVSFTAARWCAGARGG
jgi:hypothetical protein